MRNIFTMTLAVIVLSTSCYNHSPAEQQPQSFIWSSLRSPKTGFCYEVVEKSPSSTLAVMAISRIDCNMEMK